MAHLWALGMVLTIIREKNEETLEKGGNGEVAEALPGQLSGATELARVVCFILTKGSPFPYTVLSLSSTNHVLMLAKPLDHGSLSRKFVRIHFFFPGPACILECCSESTVDQRLDRVG